MPLQPRHRRNAGRLMAVVLGLGVALGGLSAVGAEPLADTGGLFDGYRALNAHSSPVVCLVTTQDPDEIREALKKPDGMAKLLMFQSRAAELSRLPCLLVHYLQIARKDLDRPNVKAIILSSWKVPKDKAHAAELDALMRETRKPFLAICGGHSLLYTAHGGKGAAMRQLNPGETDLHPTYFPGQYKEWGPMEVRVVQRDPLFDGLPDRLVVPEMHYAECKVMPPDFQVLASSEECRVQVIKHKARPVYGTQFHPERYDEQHLDGRVILTNFFRLAGCGN